MSRNITAVKKTVTAAENLARLSIVKIFIRSIAIVKIGRQVFGTRKRKRRQYKIQKKPGIKT
jgi:hypothetical protein